MRIETRSRPDLLDLVRCGCDRTAMVTRPSGRAAVLAAAGVVALALSGCTSPSGGDAATPVPLPSASVPSPSASTTPSIPTGPVQPAGQPSDVVTGLTAPWSVVPVDGSILISERDAGTVVEVRADGSTREAGRVDGVVPGGEGGLLGLALREVGGERWLYAYFTAQDDNRIVRMPLTGRAGSFRLGTQQVLLSGLAKAGNH